MLACLRYSFLCFSLFICICQSRAQVNDKPGKPVITNITIDMTKIGQPVSKLVYGQFIELLFNYFEGGLWAEMIGDRKFFYPVNSAQTRLPVNTRDYLGTWKPAGSDSYITMDSVSPYTGEHAPHIQVEQKVAHGISQDRLSFKKDKKYSGYLVLKGSSETSVTLTIVSSSQAQKQTFTFDHLTSSYTKYPFDFTASASTENGSITIEGTGNGSFTIGTVSLMPADNVQGFRKDILDEYKKMNLHIIRWGGNASSGYDWRNGIGERDRRPPRYDYAWNAVESNDVGTDDYLALCKILSVEPYIGVNAGMGDAYSASQWVEYVNGKQDSPMGKLRAANGHPEPYSVKWWGIGNEMYGEWQLGHVSIDNYIVKHKLFAEAMRRKDSSILLVASGASPYEMGATSVYTTYPNIEKLPYQYGSKKDWSGNLLRNASSDMNFIAEHLYPVSDSAYSEEQQKFVYVNDSLSSRVRRLPNRIKGAVEAYNHYIQTMPFIKGKNIMMAMDEWRMKDGWGMEDALSTAEGFNEIARHTDVIKMTAYTSTGAPSCLLYNGTDAALQPNGLAIQLYSTHFGTLPVSVSGTTPQPELDGTKGVDKPDTSSGSNTYPLDVAAALTSDSKNITIAIVNPTLQQQRLQINCIGKKISDYGNAWTIGSLNLKATNKPGKQAEVVIKETPATNLNKIITLDPASVTIITAPVK